MLPIPKSTHTLPSVKPKNWNNVIESIKPLGQIAEMFARALTYKIEIKRLEIEEKKIIEQANLAHHAIERTYQLKLEELSQKRQALTNSYNLVYKELNNILNQMLKEETSKLNMFLELLKYTEPEVEINNKTIKINKEDITNALKLFKDNYEIPKKDIPMPVSIYLIKKNFLFLNPIEETLKPQSFLVWNAIKNII